MFERFTNRARHVVVLAQEEARLLSHNYIGTEHILLGLLGEPESVAGKVLTSFGITREATRAEVEERVGRGKKPPSGHIPFTPRAKKTLELSLREALSFGHNYIGTEHILLGLMRESDGVAAQILREHSDLAELRAAVVEAVPPGPGRGAEPEEGGDETNAVLRWLRQRLSRHGSSVPFRPDVLETEPGTRGTPAVEAALQEAAKMAGPLPVGSHHLLLAALQDGNSAASWALASLGVDVDELREKLRSAKVAGTSDEQPEQAGRRQMSIQVTGEVLTLVLTDPVIVEAGREALRATHARAAALAASGDPAAGGETTGEGAAGEESGAASVTSTVIRGDHPGAANLAAVWLELRETLASLAGTNSPAPRGKKAKVARTLQYGPGGGGARLAPGEQDPGEQDPGKSDSGESDPGESAAGELFQVVIRDSVATRIRSAGCPWLLSWGRPQRGTGSLCRAGH